jgi:hypothetical protein
VIALLHLADRRDRGGSVEADYELRQAYLRAALAAAGVESRQVVERDPGTIERAAALTLRGRPEVVVVAWSDDRNALHRAAAEALRRAAPDVVVALSGVPASRLDEVRAEYGSAFDVYLPADAQEAAARLGALAPGRTAPWAAAGIPSPYVLGLVPRAAAARIGVDAARPLELLLEELRFLDESGETALTVPLHGPLPLGELGRLGSTRIRLAGSVDWGELRPGLLQELAAAGFAELELRIGAEVDPVEVERVLAATEEHWISARLLLELPADGEPDVTEDLVLAVADVAPEFTHVWVDASGGPAHAPSGLVLPELHASTAWREQANARRVVLQHLRTLEEGIPQGGPGYADCVLDLLWENRTPPVEHREWLGGIVGFESVLFRVFRGDAAEPAGEPLPFCRCAPLLLGESFAEVAGARFELVPYAAGRGRLPDVPVIVCADEPDDLEALFADADDAHASGGLPALLCHPLSSVRNLALLAGGGDASGRLVRLVVDADGHVRPARGAAPLGRIGDSLRTLRLAALAALEEQRQRLRAIGAPDSFEPCLSVPEWLGIEELWCRQRVRPWLPRLAAAAMAVRLLASRHPEVATAQGLAAVRVSGFGEPLLYDGPCQAAADPRAPFGLALGEAHYLYDPVEHRIAACTPDLACVHEALSALDADGAAEWLAARRRIPHGRARDAVRAAADKLRSARMLAGPAAVAAYPAQD